MHYCFSTPMYVYDSIFEVAMMSAGNAFLIHQFYPTRDHVRYTNCLQFLSFVRSSGRFYANNFQVLHKKIREILAISY